MQIYFSSNMGACSAIILLSFSNLETMCLMTSNVFGLSCFNAPLSNGIKIKRERIKQINQTTITNQNKNKIALLCVICSLSFAFSFFLTMFLIHTRNTLFLSLSLKISNRSHRPLHRAWIGRQSFRGCSPGRFANRKETKKMWWPGGSDEMRFGEQKPTNDQKNAQLFIFFYI